MPFSRKSGEESCSNNNRKKNRTIRATSPTPTLFCSPRSKKEREGERARMRQQQPATFSPSGKQRRIAENPLRPYTPRPLKGQHSPSPPQSTRRVRHASSDHLSFSPPVESATTPSGRKTAGMYCPTAGSVRTIRDYLSNSLWSGRSGGGCCTPATESQTPTSTVSRDHPDDGPPVKQFNTFRDSTSHSSQYHSETADLYTQTVDENDDWLGGNRQVASLLSGARKCQTPDSCMTTPVSPASRKSPEAKIEARKSPPAYSERRGQEWHGYSHIVKRCQYLEAEVEYLRERETELHNRVVQIQEENSRLTQELKALDERYHEALDAKRTAQEACSDNERSLNRLHAVYNKKSQEFKELKTVLESERSHWMESMQYVQERLDRERQRCVFYKTGAMKQSVLLNTSDTDISLNDFFEDGSAPPTSDFQAGNLSSSVNNSPGLSPRTLEDLRVENKRLLDENKRLREECEELESCRKMCQQRHKLDMLKQDGNKAFQAGKYEEALECYSAAFDEVNDDPRMRAVLHCNRAAALYNMERFLGAIVSCCCAIDCDDSYLRAYQRRASAYEAIGDLSSAVQDITYLINSGSNTSVARDAQLHLTELQRKLKRSKPIDAYKILGLPMSATGTEIKSHYRKLALQFHPDKAQEKTGTAEAFKLVSHAYAMLSDEARRKKYDASLLRSHRSSPAPRRQ